LIGANNLFFEYNPTIRATSLREAAISMLVIEHQPVYNFPRFHNLFISKVFIIK